MKRVLLLSLAAAIAIATVPMFAAFEAHIINVTATIENAMAVNVSSVDFGIVFPQEHLWSDTIKLATSQSFSESDRLVSMMYHIKQKPKVRSASPYDVIYPTNYGIDLHYDIASGISAHEYCLNQYQHLTDPTDLNQEYYTYCYPSLCPYLSKEKDPADPFHGPTTEDGALNTPYANRTDRNDYGVTAFHDPFSQDFWASGWVGRGGEDWWKLDLAVPCFAGECAQDWPTFVNSINPAANPNQYILPQNFKGQTMGCDIWIEVAAYREAEPNN